MSKVFYDFLLDFGGVEKRVNAVVETTEERHELWQLIDEIIHHRLMGCVFDCLPQGYYEEFLGMFEEKPYDENLIEFLEEKSQTNIHQTIAREIEKIISEIDEIINLQ